mmetsp:Transcript_23288/g.38391  ORF Transcript_23288/g.38391 Transcript_23288/m.38391 type:complete len:562 (+) Transcript_23288:61-1746(+)
MLFEQQHDSNSSAVSATYLVIGAGTAGLSFIDSLLTLDANATVILVDRNSQPGGHWTKSYPFVKLHQTSCNYGVNSLPLSNIRDKKGNERFSVHDLATGQEILDYYAQVVEQFRACGRVHLYFNCEYSKDDSGNHLVTNIDTNEVTRISCKKIVVVHNNVLVPSMRNGAPFPIDSSINYAPLNDLPTHIESKQYKKYCVIGAGKTGSDAITYLLRNGVDQSAITWITSRDVWYFVRDGLWGGYKTFRKDTVKLLDPLVKCKTLLDVMLQYEKDGMMARIDTSTMPKVFKGATIDKSELAGFRSIKDIVRMGRVTSITSDEIKLERGTVPLPASPVDTFFVDCMADLDGSFYGYRHPEGFKIFDGNQINLGPSIVSFNFSCSSAVIAYIETVFEDDSDMRNNLLYFPAGEEHTKPTYKLFFNQFYFQCKVFAALGAYPPAMQFVLNSRTYLDAPCHHYMGMPGLLWAMFGPMQLAKKANKFVERVESGDFPDCQDCFGCAGRKLPDPKELKIKEKSMVKSNYPPQKKSKPKSKLSLNCCATVDVIEKIEGSTTVKKAVKAKS